MMKRVLSSELSDLEGHRVRLALDLRGAAVAIRGLISRITVSQHIPGS